MNNKNVWHSFQGCVIAAMPILVSVLMGVATYYFLKRLEFSRFFDIMTAVIVGMLAFQALYILKERLGE